MPKFCVFCRTRETSIRLGEIYQLDNLSTHYFCMLLSAQIKQSGKDNEGILGFTYSDILAELKRGQRTTCTYCKKSGATLQCHKKSCLVSFHLPCGLKQGIVPIFKGNFPCWCPRHSKNKKIKVTRTLKNNSYECNICLMQLNLKKEKSDIIRVPCCKVVSLIHRECAQMYANNAGYGIKCPICQDKPKFTNKLLMTGVFVPERDSSWEIDSEFQDLAVGIGCEMIECAAESRTQDKVNTLCELITCLRCNAAAAHRVCAGMNLLASKYYCISCKFALNPPETKFDSEWKSESVNEFVESSIKETCSPSLLCNSPNGKCDDNQTVVRCFQCQNCYQNTHPACNKPRSIEWTCLYALGSGPIVLHNSNGHSDSNSHSDSDWPVFDDMEPLKLEESSDEDGDV